MEDKEYRRTLVFAAKHGNEKSFGALYEMYYEKIYALALTTLKNAADAEDALQMAFIRAWQSIRTLEDIDAFNSWIQRIALHQCYDILRKKNIRIPFEDMQETVVLDREEEELALPQAYAERRDLNERLKAVIDTLSDVQRQTVMLYYFSELSVEEIAQVMGCSEGTVKSRLFLARKSIKTEIEERERRSGERFYGVVGMPMLPFSYLFVLQVKRTMIPRTAALGVLRRAAAQIGRQAAVPSAAQPAAQLGRNVAQQVGGTDAKIAAQTGAKTGTKAAAAGVKAAKTGAKAALSKKIIALSLAAVVALGGAGGTLAYVLHKRAETAAAQSESANPANAMGLKDAELGDQEDALKEFLEGWFYLNDEYDCKKINPQEHNDFRFVLGQVNVIDYSNFPVTAPVTFSTPEEAEEFALRSGINGTFDQTMTVYDKQSVYWVAKNVLNMSESDIDNCIQDLLQTDAEIVHTATGEGGREIYYLSGGNYGIESYPDFTNIKTDGEKYYITYDLYLGGPYMPLRPYREESHNDYMGAYYAEMELKQAEGKEYWSMYRNSKTIPEDMFTQDAPEMFSLFDGEYTQQYKHGELSIRVNRDGTFSGTRTEEHYSDENIDTTVEYEYSGGFAKPQRIDKYTYRVEVSNAKNKVTKAYDGDSAEPYKDDSRPPELEDGLVLYFYVKGTPPAKLKMPEQRMKYLAWLDDYDSEDGLPYNCIYNPDEDKLFTLFAQ